MAVVKLGYIAIQDDKGNILDRQYPRLATVEEPEYPGDWFKTHRCKPKWEVTTYEGTKQELAMVVDNFLVTASLPVEVAVYLMYTVGLDIKEKLTEDWSSHGIPIAKKGDEICPWDLLTVTLKPEGALPGKSEGVAPRKLETLMAIVTIIHRIIVAEDRGTDHYRSEVVSKCANLLSQPPYSCADANLPGTGGLYNHWKASRSYLTAIAALDMFFTEFPMSKHAKLRMGTIPSRYKDCAIINSISQLEVASNMKVDELFCWCFLEILVRDVIRISMGGQELGEKRSYTPYMSDMGLSKRSPYSATLNANLHVWCHCVGTFLGSASSPRARIPREVSRNDIIRVAEILGFAKRAHTPMVMRIFQTHEEAVANKAEVEASIPGVDDADQEDSDEEDFGDEPPSAGVMERKEFPKQLSHKAWYQLLSERNYVTPPVITRCMRRVVEGQPTPRAETVGEMLATHYKGLKD